MTDPDRNQHPKDDHDPSAGIAADRLTRHLADHPELAERIHRELLMAIHRRGIASIDYVLDQARIRLGRATSTILDDPNQPERHRLDLHERDTVEELTRELAGRHLTESDIDDLVNLTLKREQVQTLEKIANRGDISSRELAEHVHRFCELPLGETKLRPAEVVGTRVALTRHFLSDQLEFIGIAKNFLQIRDFDDITRRIIGHDEGSGRIGGKAGGMILAHRILAAAENDPNPFLPLAIPESWYLRSDVVEEFLRLNRLDEYQSQKYKPIEDVAREYPLIRGVFRNGDFPLRIVQQLRKVLDDIGTHPLIVRSSSLLEDRLGTSFCGKYASVFLANQGSSEERLRALLGAIAEVYASVMSPDPILYRREHQLIDYVEEMAVLIQKVVGVRFGDYFLPALAGVAFSRNEYRWSPRIRREDGLARIVMGLGTRAVDRSGADYPRMVALGNPTLRTESTVSEIMRCAQQTLDVIDLRRNRLTSVRLTELLTDGLDLPMLDRLVSIYRDEELYAPTGSHVDAEPNRIVITFDKLLRSTPFADRLRGMLQRLEQAYGVPVDMEFACDGERLYMLQCRTQSQAIETGPVRIPTHVPSEDVLFDARKFVRTGSIEGIEYVVYVDPAAYDAIPVRERRVAVARTVGRLNHRLPKRRFILIGPGRWGSNDIRLGVPVRYADINHTRMLIEVARQKDGFMPEVSFGTHFFQDLVEADIHYLPLYPDEPPNRFNESFLNRSANQLADLLPEDAEFAGEIHVVHIPEVTGGKHLSIFMDGESDRALAFLV